MKKEIKYDNQTDRSTRVFVLALVGSIFLFLGGFALFGAIRNKKKEEDEVAGSAASTSNFPGQSNTGFKCLSTSYPIQFGTCHPDVNIIQRHLKKLGAQLGDSGNNQDGVDGQFGPKTLEATRQYLNKEIFSIQDVQNIRKQLQA